MSQESDEAFTITVRPPPPARPASPETLVQRALGLRGRLEYAHEALKRAKDERKAADKKLGEERDGAVMDLIEVSDSIEDVLRQMDDRGTAQWGRDALRITLELIADKLETRDVFRVELIGKTYKTVEFEGANIPEPWKVVGGEKRGRKDTGPGDVKKVQRSLWVRRAGERPVVLRRAEVVAYRDAKGAAQGGSR